MKPVSIVARMRDWLIYAGSDELFDHYCGYTAHEVVVAMEEMYPGGVIGFVVADPASWWPTRI